MPRRWQYRIGGQESSLLDFADLQQLLREARISPNSEVRAEGSRTWFSARTVPELFQTPTNSGDNDSPSAGQAVGDSRIAALPADAATAQAATILDGLEIISDPSPRKRRRGKRSRRRSAIQRPDQGVVNRTNDESDVTPVDNGPALAATSSLSTADPAGWYCRIELGPISWEVLQALVASRLLAANDQVRPGTAENWMPARTIDGLFVADSLAAVSIPDVAAESALAAPVETPSRSSNAPVEMDSPLLQPLVQPEAMTESAVADATTAEPAPQPTGDPTAEAPTTDAPSAETPTGDTQSAEMPTADTPSADTPTAESPTAESPTANTPPESAAAVADPPQIADPAVTALPPPEAAPLPPSVVPERPVIRVALPRPRRHFRNPLRGMGSAIGSGVGGMVGSLGSIGPSLVSVGSRGAEGLASQWKALTALAAVLAVAAALYAFPSKTGASRTAAIYADTRAMWETATQLKKNNRPDEWRAFTAVALPQSTALVSELQLLPAKNPMLDLMLKCHRDCLTTILKGNGRDNPEEWSQLDEYMRSARKMAIPK